MEYDVMKSNFEWLTFLSAAFLGLQHGISLLNEACWSGTTMLYGILHQPFWWDFIPNLISTWIIWLSTPIMQVKAPVSDQMQLEI